MACLCAVGPATAQTAKTPKTVKTAKAPGTAKTASDEPPADVSKFRDKMVVLHDGAGHYVIAVPTGEHYSTLFYGDGKTFHEQVVFGGGMNEAEKSLSVRFWDPRVNHQADVEQEKGAWHVKCDKRTTQLKPMPAAEAKQLLASAKFLKPMWRHSAYALARDDRGNYYYVDRLRDEHGGKGFRMWVGPKGAMKPMKMTNIVSDSQGDIFATKTGELRFILSQNDSAWVSGKNRTTLVNVPVTDNLKLIYTELGVYLGDLGTPCDHF